MDSGTHNRAKSWRVKGGRRHCAERRLLLQGSAGSWILSSSAPSYWSPGGGPVPCSSLASTPDCSHPPCQSTSPCAGLWSGVVRSPLRPEYHHSLHNLSRLLQNQNTRKFCVWINVQQHCITHTPAWQTQSSAREGYTSDWGRTMMCKPSLWPWRHMAHQPAPTLLLANGTSCPHHCSLVNSRTSSQSYYVLCQTEKELDTEFWQDSLSPDADLPTAARFIPGEISFMIFSQKCVSHDFAKDSPDASIRKQLFTHLYSCTREIKLLIRSPFQFKEEQAPKVSTP